MPVPLSFSHEVSQGILKPLVYQREPRSWESALETNQRGSGETTPKQYRAHG
jgi:hypothetical protein